MEGAEHVQFNFEMLSVESKCSGTRPEQEVGVATERQN